LDAPPRESARRLESGLPEIALTALGLNECSGPHDGRNWQRLEFLARLEAHSLAGRDVDLLSGARVASNARLARFDVEDAEAAQFDALSSAERILHSVEDSFDRLLGFRAGYVRLLYDGVYDVELDHKTSGELPRWPENLC
jgi:hypothetical protein